MDTDRKQMVMFNILPRSTFVATWLTCGTRRARTRTQSITKSMPCNGPAGGRTMMIPRRPSPMACAGWRSRLRAASTPSCTRRCAQLWDRWSPPTPPGRITRPTKRDRPGGKPDSPTDPHPAGTGRVRSGPYPRGQRRRGRVRRGACYASPAPRQATTTATRTTTAAEATTRWTSADTSGDEVVGGAVVATADATPPAAPVLAPVRRQTDGGGSAAEAGGGRSMQSANRTAEHPNGQAQY